MSHQDEVREVLNQTRMAITDVRVAMLRQAKREIEIENLARDLGVPVVDVEDWLEFMARKGQV